MTDARLVATNPADSTLVPVSCNSRGELSTQAPTIELIPNDVEVDGNLVVTGTINGSSGGKGEKGDTGDPGKDGEPGGVGPAGPQGDPGEGLPLPYGTDGTYLQIVSGAPAWTDSPGPSPGPDPEQPEILNFDDCLICTNSDQSTLPQTNPLVWAQGLSSWNAPEVKTWEGLCNRNETGTLLENKFVLSTPGSFGKVITLFFSNYRTAGGSFEYRERLDSAIDNANVQFVSRNNNEDGSRNKGQKWWAWSSITYLFTREVAEVEIVPDWDSSSGSSLGVMFRGWLIQDQGAYALSRQIEMEQEIKRLRGVIMDIDPLSQS